ncbi:DUF1294 domain-containing protein [Yeguia hominis]
MDRFPNRSLGTRRLLLQFAVAKPQGDMFRGTIGRGIVQEMMLDWRFIGAGYLVLINGIVFVLFGVDKRRARRQQWRIPEATLLGFAALGGSIGALLGMRLFHHKTRHPKFFVGVPVILGLQIALAVVLWLRFG